MNLFGRLARNGMWLLAARLGAQGCMVLVTYLLARRLGTAGFGEYAFLAAALVIGNVLTTFGSDMVLIREIAARSDLSAAPPALMIQLTLSALFITGVFVLAPHLPNQSAESTSALKVYSFALIPLAFFTVFTSMLRGAQHMTAYAWLNLSIAVVQTVAIFLFVQTGTNIIHLAYILLGVQLIGAILGGMLCAVFFPRFWQGLEVSLQSVSALLAACLPVALIAILGIAYQKSSIAMLSFLGTASLVGIFSAAARLVEAARLGHVAMLTALYPALANDESPRKALRASWLFLLSASLALSALLFGLARPSIDLLFGAAYQPAVPALRILAFSLIPYTVNSFLSLLFLARKKETVILRVLTVSLLALLAANALLIPRAGAVGASWAVLLAESVQAAFFSLAWLKSPLRQGGLVTSKGVSHELPDLP